MSKHRRAIEAELEEIFGREEDTAPLQHWPTFDRKALHGIAGEIVQLIEPHTESDPAALLLQMLTAVGNIIGRNSYYQTEADRQYPNINTCIVGPSGAGKKGTSWGQAIRVVEPIDEAWRRTCIASGLSSGEGLIYRVRDELRKKERKQTRKKTGPIEYEEVIADHGVDDKRLLVVETEFSQALRVIGREGNILSVVIRNAWDGRDLDILTKNPLRATGAHISIIGHITCEELTKLLNTTEAANGFANRFLWVCVRRSKLLPHGGHLNAVNFSGLHKDLRTAVDCARRDSVIPMDSEASEFWSELYEKLTTGRPGLMGAVTSRASTQTLRLALIYALLDCSRAIRWEHLDAAYRVWNYCEQSARFIFGDRLGDPIADKILAALQQKGSLSRTQISELFGRHKSAKEIDAALRVLLVGGFAHPVVQSTDGRDVEYWVLGCEKSEISPP